ncbi:unnamed protein product [Dicrocoelium dendriticum]|nr:unnamed protein product [Dicrocoelium dendriticum]
MHASLAYIGRACTVDDDEPPETPTYNSLDSQSGGAREKYPQADTGLALRELVDKSLPLSASIGMVTLLNKVAHLCQEPHRRNGEEPTFLCQHTRCSDELSGTDQTAHLIQPTRLHRLCELISGAVRLDVLDGVTNEIGSGLFDLTRHAEITALEQYKNFEQCIRALFYNPNLSAFPTTDQRIRCTQGCHSASPFPHTPSISNQLGELRVLCEGIRQCLSQVTQFTHEKHTICHFTDRMAHGSMRSVYDSELDTLPHYFNVKLNSLICTSLLAAHHLAYSGLCTIAHIELTCFTHGELWEMLRGVEELDILSNSVHTMRQTSRTLAVVQNLFQAVAYLSSSSLIEQLMIHQNLFWDPILSVSSVSLGYLFVLLAHHRSFRLSYAIYCELLSISNYSDPSEAGLKDKPLDDPKSKHTLLEEFRRYLNEHYHRTDPDYLRAEYDFIANFLDVLSQSTNLLHQVQTLKAVCTTGTGAQAKRTEILRETQLPTASTATVLEPDMPHSFRALSVEGKHGILLRRDSGDKASGSAHFSQRVRSSQDRRNFILQFQDTLHRACTFDRYVATGSVLCSPMNSDSLTSKYPATVVPTGTPGAQISAGQHSSKKSVQWSDHREVSIRHQVISRFLEMIWHHTETLLNDLVLCPPASSVAACQVCDLPPCRQTDHDLNAPLNPPKVNAHFVTCLTMSSVGLQQLSRRIKEVAKADIFPIGLAPAIGRQALILEHLAHRRCCYADMVKHKHRLLNLAAVNLPPATSSERPQYLKPESPISQRVACHSDCESTWNFPKPFFLSECCVSLRDIACASATSNFIQQCLSAASPMSLDPQNKFPHFLPVLQSREFCTSFIPLLQLTFTCARALGNCVPGGLHHQVTHIEKQLRVIGRRYRVVSDESSVSASVNHGSGVYGRVLREVGDDNLIRPEPIKPTLPTDGAQLDSLLEIRSPMAAGFQPVPKSIQAITDALIAASHDPSAMASALINRLSRSLSIECSTSKTHGDSPNQHSFSGPDTELMPQRNSIAFEIPNDAPIGGVRRLPQRRVPPSTRIRRNCALPDPKRTHTTNTVV